jgi:hypothetical protein
MEKLEKGMDHYAGLCMTACGHEENLVKVDKFKFKFLSGMARELDELVRKAGLP